MFRFVFRKETYHRDSCLERTLQVQRKAFWAIGIDPTSLEKTIISPFRLFVPLGTLSVYVLSVAVFCCIHLNNINKVTDALVPALQSFLAIIKIIIFWRKRHIMVPLLCKLQRIIDETKNEDERRILIEENWNDMRLSLFFYVVYFCSGYSALMSPFVSGGISYYFTGEFVLQPPIEAQYPLDLSVKGYYAIQHLWLDVAVWGAIFGSSSMDTLFSFTVNNVIAQFRILIHRLEVIKAKDPNSVTSEHFSHCVRFHLESISLAEDLRSVYAPICFAKFLISCLQICCLVYQTNRMPEVGDLIFYMIFLVACAVQLLVYCLHGQRLTSYSELVGYHFYDNFNVDNTSRISKQYYLLPMSRALRPCEMTGVFFNVDLSLYLWVFKTAGSFITMLWTLEEK